MDITYACIIHEMLVMARDKDIAPLSKLMSVADKCTIQNIIKKVAKNNEI